MAGFCACARCSGEGWVMVSLKKRKCEQHRPRARRPCGSCNGCGVGPSAQPPVPAWPTSGHVAVVGGGIGGAAVALALQQRGISVRVYERDDAFSQRSQGYALTMQQGANALRLLGLQNEGVFSHTHHSFLPDGQLLGRYGRAVHASTRERLGNGKGCAQRRNAHLPRQTLRARLLEPLLAHTVQWGRHLNGFEEDAHGVTLHFASGHPSERAAFLIGADGIHSVVGLQRRGGASPLRYLGVVVVLGRAACEHELACEQVFQTLDGETRIFCMPFSADPRVTMWQLSFPMAAAAAQAACRSPPPKCSLCRPRNSQAEEAALAMARDGASLKAEALRRCGGWHQPIPQLLADTLPADVTGYPAFDCEPSPISEEASRTLSGARVALLGDAAHPMSPFKGQGANQALIDAVALARALRSSEMCGGKVELSDAVALYEAEMSQRTTPKVLASREAAEALHSPAATSAADCTRAAAARGAITAGTSVAEPEASE